MSIPTNGPKKNVYLDIRPGANVGASQKLIHTFYQKIFIKIDNYEPSMKKNHYTPSNTIKFTTQAQRNFSLRPY